jgi:hypothetical protein
METSVSKDEIKEWKKDGWVFRVKEVKGKQYITRRNGKQERGLGRYDDKLWRLIKNTSIEPSDHERRKMLELETEKNS